MKRLDKILTDLNFGSRKEVRKLIKNKQVKVNQMVVRDAAFKIAEADELMVNNKVIEHNDFVYFLLNKPKGYISATEDNSPTVIDLIHSNDKRKGIFPVGRLDKDTTGLLLITNDGALSHQLLSPKKHVEKEYFALIEGMVTEELVAVFSKGIRISPDFTTMPSKLKIVKTAEISEVYLTIHEGKFHQVKRMFKAVGMRVIELKRVRMKELVLDDLPQGEYRPLTKTEVNNLKNV